MIATTECQQKQTVHEGDKQEEEEKETQERATQKKSE
jgi:hypothetical protein